MFYIYFLYSEPHQKYYVGHTDNPERRLEEHNTGTRMTFTHKFRPWVLKTFYPVSENRGLAIKIERFIKQQKSQRFIIELIDNPSTFQDILTRFIK